jgi:sensor c-di-GMP phosphodiesterase-like protein
MVLRWTGLASVAFVAASVTVFTTGAHFAATALIDQQRSRQLQELNETALRRSEAAIDLGIRTLDDLVARAPIGCGNDALQAMRLHIYQHSSVKDIRIADHEGSVRCSAYPETLEFDKTWTSRAQMLPARDKDVRLFRVEQFFGIALGVMKDLNEHTSLVAILPINASLFDLMPAELRSHSRVALELANEQEIAHYSSTAIHEAEGIVAVEKASEPYPLHTEIDVDARAYEHWHGESYVPIMVLGIVLGLAFGGLLAHAVARPKSPTAEMDRALAAGEFKPYLQPIFHLETGAITGCEALVRWVQCDGTVVPPARFIQLAESSGRIEPMTWQMITATLKELHALLSHDKSFRVSFNVTPHHLVSETFVDELRRIVADAGVSPRQIVLEVTEREELADLAQAAEIIAALREHGFKVAIDDVGIGHSGLSQVQRLGANTMKIDKFFVDSVTRDTTATAVIHMLVRLATELKMSVVAEGIETQEQVSALLACGIAEGQGYVTSPPLPVSDFITFVRQRTARRDAEHAGARAARVA